MEYFIKLIKKKYKVDVSKDARAKQKLRREAERAKRALSSQHQVRGLAVGSRALFLVCQYSHGLLKHNLKYREGQSGTQQ
jgi:hypothetical protein